MPSDFQAMTRPYTEPVSRVNPQITRRACGRPAIEPRMARKGALSPHEAEKVLHDLAELVKEAGSQGKAGEMIGVSQQTVSRVLRKELAPGPDVAAGLARLEGLDPDEYLGRIGSRKRTEPSLGELDGWKAAEAVARQTLPALPERAWRVARSTKNAFIPDAITPQWVWRMAMQWAEVGAGKGDETEQIRRELGDDREDG